MTFDIESLGPVGFQDLAAALALDSFGPGVQVMGPGPDGGRDMYHDGRMVWSVEDGEVWDGYTVFQAKHRATPSTKPGENLTWLWAEIRAELESWASSPRRSRVPDYILVVTNVPLSAAAETGGHDEIIRRITRYIDNLRDGSRDVGKDDRDERLAKLARLSGVRKWRVWDRYQVEGLIRRSEGVRRSFKGFLTAADIFAHLADFTDQLPIDELEPALRSHARTTLTSEGIIYFDEAGSGDVRGFPIHEVAIDLPIVRGTKVRETAIHYVLDRAEHVLKPRLGLIAGPRHLIITGAPGNGKTTLSKFLVQMHRAAMLAGAEALSVDQAQAIAGAESALARMGRSMPRHRRWAIRIDLAEYVQEGGADEDATLLKWIAQKVSKRSNAGIISARALHSWMQQWPWFLVLDGLDEVSEPQARKRLIERVTELVNDAEADNADVLVVLTTRPMGYTENIAPSHFERVDLGDLEPGEAVRYGVMATQVRLVGDLDRIEKVVRQLKAAADDDALVNLLRTPLQVMILTIIIDAAGQLAPDRYSLFWGYFETVLRRESNKTGALGALLREYGLQTQQLHERVGFELQVRSELSERSYATLTLKELQAITWQVLLDSGFKPDGKDRGLLDQLTRAATHRLVLIAPRGDEGYGFDVRSLQELMAAMHMTSGTPEIVRSRMRIATASPHWRNTWLFAAGRLFASPQQHQHEMVVDLVEGADLGAEGRLGAILPIAPGLALDVLDDGMARALPRWRERLAGVAMRVLFEPADQDFVGIVRRLLRFADGGSEQQRAVSAGLRKAMAGSLVARRTAGRFQYLVDQIADASGVGLGTKALSRALPEKGRKPAVAPQPRDWSMVLEEIETRPMSAPARVLTDGAMREIESVRSRSRGDLRPILLSLQDGEAAAAIEAALLHVRGTEPNTYLWLRKLLLPEVLRVRIGETLRDPGETDGV